MRALVFSAFCVLLIASAPIPAAAQYGGGANQPGAMGGAGTTGSGSNYGNRTVHDRQDDEEEDNRVAPNAPCTSEDDRPDCAPKQASESTEGTPQSQ